MDTATPKVSQYIKNLGISVSVVSRNTGISKGVIYPCITGKRAFRADEFMEVCSFLDVVPRAFSSQQQPK